VQKLPDLAYNLLKLDRRTAADFGEGKLRHLESLSLVHSGHKYIFCM